MRELMKLDARIPQWDFSDLVERRCPICSSAGTPEFVRPDKLVIRRCFTCGAWYISPAPSENQLGMFYSKYSTQHHRFSNLSDYDLAQEILASRPEESIVMQEIISMKNIDGAKCLDVGFGRGRYLHWIKMLGGLPVGVDLDPHSVRCVKEFLGISDVREGTIFDVGDSEKYDVVLLMDFVEHPLDVLRHLKKAASLLSRSGLMVVFTPNASFVSIEDNPVVLRVDLEHMQYFTFQTCGFVAKDLNLRLVHLESYGYPDMAGIDTSRPRSEHPRASFGIRMKKLVRSFPGFQLAKAVKRSLQGDPDRQMRLGRYHLFCVLEKSA